MASSQYDVSPQDLSDLVTNRDSGSTKDLYDKWGGPEGLAKKLKSDLKHGVTTDGGSVADRAVHFGPNTFPKKPPQSFFSFWLEALNDRTLQILMGAAIFSIAFGVGFPPDGETRETAWIEGFAILVAVALVSLVTAGNSWSKDRKFRQLSEMSADRTVKVIREGKQTTIPSSEVVVGDVVILETGDYIPADLIYIYGQSISCDEAPMTGEPEAIDKNPENPWFLSGCMVMEGFARGIVIAVGVHSQWGKIKAALDTDEVQQTPLQEKLEELAENIGKIGVVAAGLTLLALILRWTIGDYGVEEIPWQWEHLTKLIHFFITAITIIVVAVPEGLPLAVTLALAYSMLKMMKDQNLVRHLAACETMGGATCICSDKTGTLTQNRMTVTKLWMAGQLHEDIPTSQTGIDDKVLNLLNEGIAVNSSAYIEKKEEGLPVFIGAKTECALLVLSEKMGSSYADIRKEAQVIRAYPFSSKKKRMSTLIRADSGYRLYTKGASEVVLELCDQTLNAEGQLIELDDNEKAKLLRTIEDWAGQGLRTLSLTVRSFNEDLELPSESEKECTLEDKLTLVAIVGIEDPLRDEVPASVETCKRAGIKVRMLTGDNILTASSIGRKCGILSDDGIAIEGPKFRKMTMKELDAILPKLSIIARCSPEDKLKLVNRLKDLGEVVAVTGDGTNDSPALKSANVGFAMGISGTEVAKDASDIILLDDNFSSIEKAVMWGRNVYDAIRKFLQFQLTVNVVAVTVAFIGAVTGGESPLSAVQMLWVNLIMDTMAALALATEPPTPELLNRPPHGRHAPLITFRMWRTLLSQAALQLFFLFFILYGGGLIPATGIRDNDNDFKFWEDAGIITEGGSLPPGRPQWSPAEAELVDSLIVPHRLVSTIIFNTFVFCQIFNEFNARRLENEWNLFGGVWKNPIFCAIWIITVIVQVIIVQFGGPVTQTTGLNASQWGFCIITALISVPVAIIMRFVPMPSDKYLESRFKKKEDEVELSSLEITQEDSQAELRLNMDPEDGDELVRRPRTASQNWKIAQGVVTKVGVISAFRKPIDYRTQH